MSGGSPKRAVPCYPVPGRQQQPSVVPGSTAPGTRSPAEEPTAFDPRERTISGNTSPSAIKHHATTERRGTAPSPPVLWKTHGAGLRRGGVNDGGQKTGGFPSSTHQRARRRGVRSRRGEVNNAVVSADAQRGPGVRVVSGGRRPSGDGSGAPGQLSLTAHLTTVAWYLKPGGLGVALSGDSESLTANACDSGCYPATSVVCEAPSAPWIRHTRGAGDITNERSGQRTSRTSPFKSRRPVVAVARDCRHRRPGRNPSTQCVRPPVSSHNLAGECAVPASAASEERQAP